MTLSDPSVLTALAALLVIGISVLVIGVIGRSKQRQAREQPVKPLWEAPKQEKPVNQEFLLQMYVNCVSSLSVVQTSVRLANIEGFSPSALQDVFKVMLQAERDLSLIFIYYHDKTSPEYKTFLNLYESWTVDGERDTYDTETTDKLKEHVTKMALADPRIHIPERAS